MTDPLMNQAEIKAEMRLCALEKVVCDLLAMRIAQEPLPRAYFDNMRNQMKIGANRLTFPSFDPAESDHYSAELENAVDRLMGMANEQISLLLKAHGK